MGFTPRGGYVSRGLTNSKGPDVDLLSAAQPSDGLGCSPAPGAPHDAVDHVGLGHQGVGQAHIRQLGCVITCQQNVGGLEVEVDDVVAVKVVQAPGHVQGYPPTPVVHADAKTERQGLSGFKELKESLEDVCHAMQMAARKLLEITGKAVFRNGL